MLCTCVVCVGSCPTGCRVSKSTKKSHDLRYARGKIHRKKSIRQTISYEAYFSARQHNQAEPSTTNSTTDNQAPSATSNDSLASSGSSPSLDFVYDCIDGDYSDDGFSFTSPDFDMGSDDFNSSFAEASSQFTQVNADELNDNSLALGGTAEEQEIPSVSGDANTITDDRIQPLDEEQEEPLVPMDTDSTVSASVDSIQFRFEAPDPPLPACEAVHASSDSWLWRTIILFVTWAHVSFHVPVRVLEVLLKVQKAINKKLGHLDGIEDAPVTVKTAFKSLGLVDNFIVFAMCTSCRRIFEREDLGENLDCTHCNNALFTESGRQKKGKDASQNLRPCLQFPFRPLSSQLSELLNREGIEDALDSWRARESDEVLRDIMDGKVWKELKGHNGKPFFNNDKNREDKDELRIGITLGFDGYVLS